MKPTLIFIIFSSTLIACRLDVKPARSVQEMDSLLMRFSAEWKQDSLGRNGFRMNHYHCDSTNKTCQINGLNFKGQSQEQILKWLGQPSYGGRHKEDNGLIMEYPVRPGGRISDRELVVYLLIYFDKDEKVDFVMEQSGMPR